jgi:putative glutamine amidotransferase
MKPLIGLPAQRFLHEDWKPILHGQRESYIQAVVAAGGIPVVIPLLGDAVALRGLYDRLDGLLLCGGGDIDPSWYGRTLSDLYQGVDLTRDHAELLLACWALADHKPILGICRGAQLINIAHGGSLLGDLPTERPSPIDHRSAETNRHMGHLGHTISLEDSSRLAALLGTTRLKVNSLHHQAVDQVGPGLRVVGHATDGVIEAIEAIDSPSFTIGLQCHPEVLRDRPNSAWQRLFSGFVGATNSSS